MLDLAAVDHTVFAACLHERFSVHANDGTITLELDTVDVREGHAPPDATRTPFSLVFIGSAAQALGQGVHRLEHEGIGSMELFLVPVAETERGLHYEAVFN